MRIKSCVCGVRIQVDWTLCPECLKEYGPDKTEWPAWVRFMATDIQRELRAAPQELYLEELPPALAIADDWIPAVDAMLDIEIALEKIAVNGLPRQIFDLYVLGYTPKDIASFLKLRRRRVAEHLSKVIRMLRHELSSPKPLS